MELDDKIVVLGAKGLVGSAFCRILAREGYSNVVSATRDQVDLSDQQAVDAYFRQVRPSYVLMAAGKVGGIVANASLPWDFIYDNVMMAANVLNACRHSSVRKVLVLGSTCIYPRLAEQPIKEEALLSGPLEKTNEWYAVAKIAGIKLGQALRRQHGISVISAMPTNLYGPNDNYHPTYSHVLPALIRRFHEARTDGRQEIEIWGTGKPRREFLYVDDLAEALLLLMKNYDEEDIINVGTGKDVAIAELASILAEVIGFDGKIVYDTSKPDGTPQKLTDVARITALGWKPRVELREGILRAYQSFLHDVAVPSGANT